MPQADPTWVQFKDVNISDTGGYPGLKIDSSTPELKKGLAYLDNETRPRRLKDERTGQFKMLERGQPGGELYPVLTSTVWDLRDFGLGVAMYFQTLQLLACAFMVCGILQANTIQFYKSQNYSDGQPGVPFMLKGSAVCTRHAMVCLDKDCTEIGKSNLCQMSQTQANLDIANTLMFFIMFAIVGMVQNHVSARLDEAMQTASDYSVIVEDPEDNDTDPEEWRKFFSQFGHVTFVTVAKNNGPLLVALANRRYIMREIIMIIGNGEYEPSDDSISKRKWDGLTFEKKLQNDVALENEPAQDGVVKVRRLIAATGFFGLKTLTNLKSELEKANKAVQKSLQETNYVASSVFITFETEIGQRNCLKALSQGILTSAFDLNKDKTPPEYLFKGTNVLSVKEASEPASVYWNNTDISFTKRVEQQSLTAGLTFMIILGSLCMCKLLQISTGAKGAAMWISITNIVIPELIRQFTFNLETHDSADDKEMSLYIKLTFFRWCNTGIVLYFITNFTDFLTTKALDQVQAVLISDAITTPLIRTLNPMDIINRFLIAPYAPTQEKMNCYFLNTLWFPAERYSDMTKTLFLALFYSALIPSGLFLTFFGYVFIYTVDKYSLLRSWRTESVVSDEITISSRAYMVMAVYSHAVMTMIYFAQFPFDNICKSPDHPKLSWFKYQQVKNDVTTDEIHYRCNQAVGGRVVSLIFGGSITRDSMYGRQQRIVQLYGVLVLCLTVFYFIVFFGGGIVLGIYSLFYGVYRTDSKAMADRFTHCEIQAYIPFIAHPGLAYPLVAADMTGINPMVPRFWSLC